MNARYKRLYNNIINSIAARNTIVIASVNLLNVIGLIFKNLCKWVYINSYEQKLKTSDSQIYELKSQEEALSISLSISIE
jgi:hypothetical protein